MRILLAEDDRNIQSIARLTLERLGGHKVTIANNGAEALQIAQIQEFDLIILDGMMPELDGFQVCTRVKAEPGPCQQTPIIFMTAKSQASDIQAGFEIGAIGYIVKPFDARTLCSEIDKLYSNQSQKMEGLNESA